MMLFYKAWRESRTRFAVSALTLLGTCGALVLFPSDAAYGIGVAGASYRGYIWHITYQNYLRELFVLMALLLAAGGLLRERAYRTSNFTLSLPVSRWRLETTRAAVGIVEIGLLSLLPAMVIPALSPIVHQAYPLSQALQFSLLWTVCGTFFFSVGFLSSAIFPGEFTAPLIALLGLLAYSVIVDVPAVERFVGDIHDIMSGAGMPYFREDTFALTGLPWASIAIILLISLAMSTVAAGIAKHRDF